MGFEEYEVYEEINRGQDKAINLFENCCIYGFFTTDKDFETQAMFVLCAVQNLRVLAATSLEIQYNLHNCERTSHYEYHSNNGEVCWSRHNCSRGVVCPRVTTE